LFYSPPGPELIEVPSVFSLSTYLYLLIQKYCSFVYAIALFFLLLFDFTLISV